MKFAYYRRLLDHNHETAYNDGTGAATVKCKCAVDERVSCYDGRWSVSAVSESVAERKMFREDASSGGEKRKCTMCGQPRKRDDINQLFSGYRYRFSTPAATSSLRSRMYF